MNTVESRPSIINRSVEVISEGFSWFRQRVAEWRETAVRIAKVGLTVVLTTASVTLGGMILGGMAPLQYILTGGLILGGIYLAYKHHGMRGGGGFTSY